MAVDVVVVNFHTNDLLKDFIGSYWESMFEGCTITVVEVAPGNFPKAFYVRDGMHDVLEQYGAVNDLIEFEENVGYARACNAGARFGKNDVILLANADTLLGRDSALLQCYDALMSHDGWGVLGPRQVNEHNQITAGGVLGTDTAPRLRGWNEPDRGQYSDVVDSAMSVSGSLYFIKRAVWEELTACPMYQLATKGQAQGAFLPTPHYFEETFCSYHARAHGYKCVYYGPAKMTHLWHKASEHGGWADRQMEISKAMHREACKVHAIVCE